MSKLKEFRTRARLPLEEAAHMIGVRSTTILRWEKGISSPRTQDVQRIQAAYDLTDAEVMQIIRQKPAREAS